MFALTVALLLASVVAPAGAAGDDVQALYQERCASCHGAQRYGGYAPPLIPQTLGGRDDGALAQAIRAGLPNTQMGGFGHEVDEAQAAALVRLLREPVAEVRWSAEDVAASRVALPRAEPRLGPEIVRARLILVVERVSGSVSVLDGDSLRELDRFPVGAVHGGIKFDRLLRRAYAATRDGTLVAYDLVRGGLATRVKVGVNTRNIAVAPDGGLVAAANQLPASLVLLDGSLGSPSLVPLPTQPSAVYAVPGRPRFLVGLRGLARLLLVEHADRSVRTLEVPEPFEDFVFAPGGGRLVASARGGRRLLLYDLEAGRTLGEIAVEGLPHLFSACFFERDGVPLAAFNHVGVPRLSVVDMRSFEVVRELPLRGAGFFARTHGGTPFVWLDTNTEAIQLLDKRSLELVEASLVPEAGKKAMHVEFTSDGSRALVSVWHPEGAVVVYDSRTLRELARLPYAMPVGKYNAANKTRWMR